VTVDETATAAGTDRLRSPSAPADRLAGCLGGGEVWVHGMPVVSLWDGRVLGVEVLARWRTPDGRVLQPAQFLPRVDEARLWADLDHTVLKAALDAGRDLPVGVGIGVNLSAASLSCADLADWLLGALHEAGVDPDRLHLELTETSVLHVGARVTAAMQEVAEAGVRWWVDDFGTGYSSISHLRDLPITGMKLDRSFTAGITDRSTRNARLALGLAGLAAGLGLDTIAEGVETPQQAQLLAEQGWQMGQGHFFGAALEMTLLRSWI
jgi:EAL domain-containing protein (putative c-di-GMP-specific phosphodiesterase class I)